MKTIELQKPAAYLVWGIVVTIPLIFGAVHPIVSGSYVYIMLVGLGSWLLLNYSTKAAGKSFPLSVLVPFLLIAFFVVQSIPVSIDWLNFLSPHRAERVHMVNTLAGTELKWISIGESGPMGIYRSLFLLGVILYYFSVKKLIADRQNFQEILINCLVVIGTVEALYGLVQFLNPQIGILWLPNSERAAHGTIIYKNQYASLLNMIWPLALASGVFQYLEKKGTTKTKQKLSERLDAFSTVALKAPLMIFAAIIMILAILFSLSRGGILAMVVIMLLLAITQPFSKIAKIVIVLALTALVGGYGALLGFDTIASRFDSLDNSGAHRISIYLSSLPMLWDHWLTGIGLGSYALLSPLYLKGFPPDILYDSVHNEYLELMIELGIPVAMLLFAWMTAGILKLITGLAVWQNPSHNDLKRRVTGIASLCGLLGFFIHGFVDFGWRLPANLIYCTTLLALCVSSVSSVRSAETPDATLKRSEAVS